MKWITVLLLLAFVKFCLSALRNPYDILGIDRRADISTIKHAYKALARKWHPDKNDASNAEEKFIEINKAYELLSDPERRKKFDQHGITEDTPNFRNQPDYSSFHRFDFDSFESFFASDSGFQFKFNYNKGSVFRKQSITTRAYENNIVPQSHKTPYFILFYGDICFPCAHAEPVWQKIVAELEPLGIGFATVHTQHESGLSKKIGVNILPYIIGVVDGYVRHYRDEQLSLLRMIEFIRRILPKSLVTTISDSNADDFLNQWHDNRVRAVFINSDKLIKLRYLITAFYFKDRIACAHLNIQDANSQQFISKYNVDHKSQTMLIFNEDTSRPTATLSAPDLKPKIMKEILQSNLFLLLPRLSSQALFDQICPVERTRKRLCVLFVTNNVPEHDAAREALRNFIKEMNFNKDKFKFMYLFHEKQEEFVQALTVGVASLSSPVLHIAVLWRREVDKVLYEWLPSPWDISDPLKLNETKAELHDLLSRLIQSTETLPYKAQVVALMDEHAHGLFGRIVKKILIMTDGIGDNITRREIVPVLSVFLSIGFIVLIGYIMQYLVRVEEESIQERYRRLGKTPPGTKPKVEFKLNIHELRGETYNGLIRLLKPGCRTIILLCDQSSKSKLLPKFYRSVYPYRRNKTLMFAYMLVEKNIEWFKKLLLQTLSEYKDLNINPKNCIGTVLSVNGFRKYFCVYHAKHPETTGRERVSSYLKLRYNLACLLQRRRAEGEAGSGAFLGFEDSSEEDSLDVEAGNLLRTRNFASSDDDALSNILFEENLLDGLENWLEKLFEGMTQRYHIQYWPEHMK